MHIFKPMEKSKELYQAEHPPDAIVKVVQYSFITCLAIREGVWNRTRGSTKAGRGRMACFRQGGAVGGFARPGSGDGGPHEAQPGMDGPGHLLRTQPSALWGWGVRW